MASSGTPDDPEVGRPRGTSHHARDLETNGVAPDAMFVVALIDLTGRIDEP
jgi:hypothetical protein